MYYHVRITRKSEPSHDIVALDLTEDQLKKRLLEPYTNGTPIVVRGTTIPMDDLKQVRISRTHSNSSRILPTVQAERAQSRVKVLISNDWLVADKGEDVTDILITTPPGSGKLARPAEIQTADKVRRRSTPSDSESTWDLFICHASEDKDEVARPLAEALTGNGLKVWFDEFTLTLGDSLSRKIDEGLANSRFGVVILSPSFFKKEWPRRELDGLTAKEISSGKTILPVWHRVDRDFVVKYSPVLADKLAVSTDKGLDKVVDEILKAISKDRSKAAPLVLHPSAESTGGRSVPENMGTGIPVARVEEEVTVRGTHLSITLLWHKESAICVHGPYHDRFYAFTAKPGMKFVIIAYRFQNNWKREQTTPYLEKGEITTHRGYIYSVWDPPGGILSNEYSPREATDEETKDLIGTSGAFEKLLPEESCVGSVAFEIPKDATPTEAVLFKVPLIFRFDE